MAEGQARKQMTTTEVEDKVRTVKSRVAFLGAALFPVMRNQEMRLNEEQMGGFHRMLDDIEDALGEIADAVIMDEPSREVRATASREKNDFETRQQDHWPEIQDHANDVDAKVKALLAFVAEVEDRYGHKDEDRSNIYEDIVDIGRVAQSVAEHTAALREIANHYA